MCVCIVNDVINGRSLLLFVLFVLMAVHYLCLYSSYLASASMPELPMGSSTSGDSSAVNDTFTVGGTGVRAGYVGVQNRCKTGLG